MFYFRSLSSFLKPIKNRSFNGSLENRSFRQVCAVRSKDSRYEIAADLFPVVLWENCETRGMVGRKKENTVSWLIPIILREQYFLRRDNWWRVWGMGSFGFLPRTIRHCRLLLQCLLPSDPFSNEARFLLSVHMTCVHSHDLVFATALWWCPLWGKETNIRYSVFKSQE